MFFYSNEVPLDLLNKSKFILVDHHVPSSLITSLNQTEVNVNERILAIFDHRPFDTKNAQISQIPKVKVNEVGSCATLIVDEIRNAEHSLENHCELIRFLTGPILLDTVNFSDVAARTKPLDVEIYGEIEKVINLTEADRLNLYKELVTARSDVGSLSAMQLLSKDLKIISNNDASCVVAFPGFPLLVEVTNCLNLLFLELIKLKSVLFFQLGFHSERKCIGMSQRICRKK